MAGNREQEFSKRSHDVSIKICKSLLDTSRSSPSYGHLWNQSHSLLFTSHKILFILNHLKPTAQLHKMALTFLFGEPELTLLLGAMYNKVIDM